MKSPGMISHRQQQQQRRLQQREVQQDQERLHQVISRLQSSLHLGLRPASGQKKGVTKWDSTDAEVQVQAARAIAAFVRTLSSNHGRPPLPQVPVEQSVAALEGLLGAEREAVYSIAADAAVRLVASTGDGLSGYGGERLVGPLAHLLKCSKLPTSISAATALRDILAKVKPKNGSKGSDDGIWGALEDAHALGTIVNSLEEESGCTGRDAAFLELLAVILERWSESRYRLGSMKSFPTILQLRCLSSTMPVAQGALHALTALALCGCSASIMLSDAGKIWSTISLCLLPSIPRSIQVEALRLLTSLCKIPTFGASFTGPHVEGIAAGCSRALEQGRTLVEMRWAPEAEILVVEAAHATSSVLSWPGRHHASFIRNGIEESLLAALLGLQNKKDDKEQLAQSQRLTSAVDRRSRGNKLNPRLRPLLWEIVGWLGAHYNSELGNFTSLATLGQNGLSGKLPALACAALSKSLRKRGRGPSWFEMAPKLDTGLGRADTQAQVQGQPVNPQEVVQICKAVLLLISSPTQAIASCTKRCLEDALVSDGLQWLPSLLSTLTLAGSNTIKIEHIQTTTNLLALACVSWLDACQEQLLRQQALQVVLGIVKAHVCDFDLTMTERLSAMSAMVPSLGAKACCIDSESWEGSDTVLFSALWALFRLLQCSSWPKEVRESVTEHMLDNSTWDLIKDGDVLHLLWKVAGDKTRSAGVRWCGVCCLACFGIYGFPSSMGKDMKTAIDDTSLADVVFVLGDGSRLSAHGVMLAARCESLLPTKLQSKWLLTAVTSDLKVLQRTNIKMVNGEHVSGEKTGEIAGTARSKPVEVQMSPRLSRESLKTLLSFVYAGIVYIPLNLVGEMKVLAKRCHMEPLTSLLQGKSPVWGQPPTPCDLSVTLGSKGYPSTDILLRAEICPRELSSDEMCRSCNMVADHLHSHRFVLSSRCNYFQALFRSGMRDSAQEEVKLPVSTDAIGMLLLYLYSAELTREGVPDCAWRYLGMTTQLGFLQSLVELAELAAQWLLEELQQMTLELLEAYLDLNVLLCLPILSLAADKQLWALVDSCAAYLAPMYPQLRDSGALDILHEELQDLVRAANVKLFMMGSYE